MSHSVTVTRTTTTTTTSAILLNTGYFKTYPGLLKLAELLIGAVCVGLVAYYSSTYYHNYTSQQADIFFLIVAVSCLIGTGCLLLSCILSISTASILPKTIYEVIFHSVAFILYLIASINLMVELHRKDKQSQSYPVRTYYDQFLAAADIVFSVVSAKLLFLSSAILLNEIRARNEHYPAYKEKGYARFVVAGILGLVNTVLYALSAILAFRSYKGK